MVDQKRCVPKESNFSRRMSDFFDRWMTLPFEELFNEDNTIVTRLKHANKSDYDIIQFSFVILNKEKNPLFIERREHDITRGFSILQSCSPYTHPEGWTYPRSLDNIRFYFEQEVECEPSDYDIDLLGFARNVRKGINYYFYVFRVDFHVEKPDIFIKTEGDPLKGFRNLDSSHLLRGNKVDLLVMRALFPEFYVSQSEIEGCILHVDPDHNLHDALFTTRELKIIPIHIADTVKDWIKVCIVQLNFSVDRLTSPNKFAYVLKEKDEVKTKVFNALEIAKREEANIICFPELSFDKEWVKEIKDLYQEMIVIGGSYYENEFNTCPVIINGHPYYVQKANPSPNFENKRGGRGMRRGKENFVFQTAYGKFAVLICFDYREKVSKILDNLDEKIKKVDFIIVPEYNKDIETFQTQADADCRKKPFPYILQVNVWKIEDKEIGGTCIIGTEHNDSLKGYKKDGYRPTDEKIKYKLIEAKGEMMIIADLDIKRKGVPVPASGDKMNPIKCYVNKNDSWIEDKINTWLQKKIKTIT